MFKNKTLMITGGTGSFGKAVVSRFLETEIAEIRIFSRDEKKQEDMRININDSKLSFYIGGSALLGEPRNGDCVRRGRPVAEYMYCDAEEAVEATKMPTEARVLWGPVTKQVADAIGVPTAVASVLLRPSSATAEATARMEALVPVPVNILPTTGFFRDHASRKKAWS